MQSGSPDLYIPSITTTGDPRWGRMKSLTSSSVQIIRNAQMITYQTSVLKRLSRVLSEWREDGKKGNNVTFPVTFSIFGYCLLQKLNHKLPHPLTHNREHADNTICR